MKSIVVAICALTCGNVRADTASIEDDSADAIEVTVAEGASANLQEALAAYNAAHAGEEGFSAVTLTTLMSGADRERKLVKKGAGCLYLTNALATASSGFKGIVSIEEGKAYCNTRYALGMENVDTAPTVVKAGAVLWLAVTNNSYSLNQNRTFRIAGSGPDGTGALYLCRPVAFTDYSIVNTAGKMVYLDDDAAIGGESWFSMNSVTLNDHTLVLTGNRQDSPKGFSKIVGDGTIIVSNSAWRTWGTVNFTGATKANRVIVKRDGQTRFWSKKYDGDGLAYWTFEYANTRAGSVSIHGDANIGARNEAVNTFTMPVVLTEKVELACQGENSIGMGRASFRGVVSGPAGFSTDSKGCTFWLHLYNAANTFKGGVTIDHGIVWPYVNGAIPSGADAGPVTLNRLRTTYTLHGFAYDGIEFPATGAYDLPALVVKGSYPGRIQGGSGAWKSVTKSETGTAEYFSEIGASTLTVSGGTFKLPRGAAPGLWEGATVYSTDALANAAFASDDTPTNLVMRAALVPNGCNQGEYSSSKPDLMYKENVTPTVANQVTTYSGYIWNRTGAPATWYFNANLANKSRLTVDGTNVIATTGGWNACTNAITVGPGPHRFAWHGYGSCTPAKTCSTWTNYWGLAWSVNPASEPRKEYFTDWTRLNDTGDGAVFTRTTNTVASLPAFTMMTFSSGTRLDLNGNRYVVNEIGGFPTVMSSATDAAAAPSLEITNALTVAGATLSSGSSLTSQVPLAFGADAGVKLTDADSVVRNGKKVFTVATAPSITWQGHPRLKTASRHWYVTSSDTAITLNYCAGTTLMVR